MSLEISQTDEWRDAVAMMYHKMGQHRDAVLQAAGTKNEVQIVRAWGQYDGFRQATEFLIGLGSQKEKD